MCDATRAYDRLGLTLTTEFLGEDSATHRRVVSESYLEREDGRLRFAHMRTISPEPKIDIVFSEGIWRIARHNTRKWYRYASIENVLTAWNAGMHFAFLLLEPEASDPNDWEKWSSVVLRDTLIAGRSYHKLCYRERPEKQEGRLMPDSTWGYYVLDKKNGLPIALRDYSYLMGEQFISSASIAYARRANGKASRRYLRSREDYPEEDLSNLNPNLPAPVPSLTDTFYRLDGSATTLADFPEGPKLLYFWYLDCAPCKIAAPALERLAEAYGPKGVQFLAFSTDSPKHSARLKAYLAKKAPGQMQYFASARTFADKSEVKAYPTIVLLDAAGHLVFWKVGFSEAVEQKISEALKKLTGQ